MLWHGRNIGEQPTLEQARFGRAASVSDTQRLTDRAPFFQPSLGTASANLSPAKLHDGATYPYPILIASADQKEDLVYAMTRAMIELFPKYKDGSRGINGWALEAADFQVGRALLLGRDQVLQGIGKWSEEANPRRTGSCWLRSAQPTNASEMRHSMTRYV